MGVNEKGSGAPAAGSLAPNRPEGVRALAVEAEYKRMAEEVAAVNQRWVQASIEQASKHAAALDALEALYVYRNYYDVFSKYDADKARDVLLAAGRLAAPAAPKEPQP